MALGALTANIIALFMPVILAAGPAPLIVGKGMSLYRAAHRGDRIEGRVLLVSGAGSNKEIWRGLQEYLTRKGYEVWMPDFADGGEWSFDEFVKEGIPAILAQIPGKPHWVGYDAGGLALLAFLSSHAGNPGHPGKAPLGKGICIGCPVRPEIPNKAVKETLDALHSNPRAPALSESLIVLLLANDGLEESQLQSFLSEGRSQAMLQDAVRWYEKSCWCSSDGSRNYADGLTSVTSPVLFISGQIDTVVPPWLSFPGVSAISSREKLFRVFGRINGYSREYGHLGLVLGKGALKEVFPVIHQWIEGGSVNRAWQEDLP